MPKNELIVEIDSKKVSEIYLVHASASSLTIGWKLHGDDRPSGLNDSQSCPFSFQIDYLDNPSKGIFLNEYQRSMLTALLGTTCICMHCACLFISEILQLSQFS